jgi:hypothetical protein
MARTEKSPWNWTSGKYPHQVIAPDSEVATTMKLDFIYCVLIVPNHLIPPPSQAIKVDDSLPSL